MLCLTVASKCGLCFQRLAHLSLHRSASSYLSDKPFMFGAKPTQLDFVLFGYVDAVLGATEEHQVYHRAVSQTFRNLWDHHRRVLTGQNKK